MEDEKTFRSGLPDTTQPLDVRLQVSDLERSLRYYTGTIGLHVLRQTDGEAQLGPREAMTPLVTLVEHAGARYVAPHSRLGLYHFAILLPSRAALGRCLQHLASVNVRVASADHWVSEALYLSDPDGLGIELYADRPREAWPRVDGRLQMTTTRLDLRDLLEAGRNEPWEGLPAGTSLGHVHLHVGDIDEASAFYGRGLGFDEIFRMPGALFVSAGGYHHHLGLNTWAEGAPPAHEDDARLIEWTLRIPDAQAAAASAARLAQAEHVVEPDAKGWTIRDPWGTRLRVVTS